MNYVEGFVVAVPTVNKAIYIEQAQRMAKLFKKHGALRVVECMGKDVPEGKLTSFTMAVQRKEDETVWFSWIEWPSKAVRDAGMTQVMDDPTVDMCNMPFDGKRMIFGGFQTEIDE